MENVLRQNERLDDLHLNGYKIIQNTGLFCFGQDAVLLAAFAKTKRGENILDFCTGNGIIPILMCGKYKYGSYSGLEIWAESAELARRNVELNNLGNRISITTGDLREAEKIYAPSSFNVITINPPYMNGKSGPVNPAEPMAIARHEIKCSLTDIMEKTEKLLTFGGRFYMIHRPQRLTDIFYEMRYFKIEPKRMRQVCPKKQKEPTMVLVEGVKGGNPSLKVLPELVIYNDEGCYTDEVMKIYYG